MIHALGSLNENHMNSSMESLQADSLITVHRDTTITVPVPNGMHTLGWPHVLKRPINPETMEDLAQGKFLDILSALLDRCQATTPASITSKIPQINEKPSRDTLSPSSNNYLKMCHQMDHNRFNRNMQETLMYLTARAALPDNKGASSSSYSLASTGYMRPCALIYEFSVQNYEGVHQRIKTAHDTLVQCYNDAVFRQSRMVRQGAGNQLRALDYVHRWAQSTEDSDIQVRAAALADGDARLPDTIDLLASWESELSLANSAESMLSLCEDESIEIDRTFQAYDYAGAIIDFRGLYSIALMHRRMGMQRCLVAAIWAMTSHNCAEADNSVNSNISEAWKKSESRVIPDTSKMRIIGNLKIVDFFISSALKCCDVPPSFRDDLDGHAFQLDIIGSAIQVIQFIARDSGFTWAESSIASEKYGMPPSMNIITETLRCVARLKRNSDLASQEIRDDGEKELIDLIYEKVLAGAKEVKNLIVSTMKIVRRQQNQRDADKTVMTFHLLQDIYDNYDDRTISNMTKVDIYQDFIEDDIDSVKAESFRIQEGRLSLTCLSNNTFKILELKKIAKLAHNFGKIRKVGPISDLASLSMASTFTEGTMTIPGQANKVLQIPLHVSLSISHVPKPRSCRTLRDDAVELALKQIAFYSTEDTEILSNPDVTIGDASEVVFCRAKRNIEECGIKFHAQDHSIAVSTLEAIGNRLRELRKAHETALRRSETSSAKKKRPKKNAKNPEELTMKRNRNQEKISDMMKDLQARAKIMIEMAFELAVYLMLADKDSSVSDEFKVVERSQNVMLEKYGIEVVEKGFHARQFAKRVTKKVLESNNLDERDIEHQCDKLDKQLYTHAAIVEPIGVHVAASLVYDTHSQKAHIQHLLWVSEPLKIECYGLRQAHFALPDGSSLGEFEVELIPQDRLLPPQGFRVRDATYSAPQEAPLERIQMEHRFLMTPGGGFESTSKVIELCRGITEAIEMGDEVISITWFDPVSTDTDDFRSGNSSAISISQIKEDAVALHDILDMIQKERLAAENPTVLSLLPSDIRLWVTSSEFDQACMDNFRELDVKGSTTLSVSELFPVVCSLTTGSLLAVTEAHCTRFIDAFDSNGDGVIDLNEFSAFMRYLIVATYVDMKSNDRSNEYGGQEKKEDGLIGSEEGKIGEEKVFWRDSDNITRMIEGIEREKTFVEDNIADLPKEISDLLDSDVFIQTCNATFEELDKDKSGIIEPEELYPVLVQMSENSAWAVDYEHCMRLASIFDTKENGVLDQDEFMAFCKFVAVLSLLKRRRSDIESGDIPDRAQAFATSAIIECKPCNKQAQTAINRAIHSALFLGFVDLPGAAVLDHVEPISFSIAGGQAAPVQASLSGKSCTISVFDNATKELIVKNNHESCYSVPFPVLPSCICTYTPLLVALDIDGFSPFEVNVLAPSEGSSKLNSVNEIDGYEAVPMTPLKISRRNLFKVTLGRGARPCRQLNLHCWTSHGKHCYYGNPCDLETDGIAFDGDFGGSGNVRITINIDEAVDYYFFVHDTTRKIDAASLAAANLSTSDAEICVECRENRSVLPVPANNSATHDFWACFDLVCNCVIEHNFLTTRDSMELKDLWPDVIESLDANILQEEFHLLKEQDTIDRRRAAKEEELRRLAREAEVQRIVVEIVSSLTETEVIEQSKNIAIQVACDSIMDSFLEEELLAMSGVEFTAATEAAEFTEFLAEQEMLKLEREKFQEKCAAEQQAAIAAGESSRLSKLEEAEAARLQAVEDEAVNSGEMEGNDEAAASKAISMGDDGVVILAEKQASEEIQLTPAVRELEASEMEDAHSREEEDNDGDEERKVEVELSRSEVVERRDEETSVKEINADNAKPVRGGETEVDSISYEAVGQDSNSDTALWNDVRNEKQGVEVVQHEGSEPESSEDTLESEPARSKFPGAREQVKDEESTTQDNDETAYSKNGHPEMEDDKSQEVTAQIEIQIAENFTSKVFNEAIFSIYNQDDIQYKNQDADMISINSIEEGKNATSDLQTTPSKTSNHANSGEENQEEEKTAIIEGEIELERLKSKETVAMNDQEDETDASDMLRNGDENNGEVTREEESDLEGLVEFKSVISLAEEGKFPNKKNDEDEEYQDDYEDDDYEDDDYEDDDQVNEGKFDETNGEEKSGERGE